MQQVKYISGILKIIKIKDLEIWLKLRDFKYRLNRIKKKSKNYK